MKFCSLVSRTQLKGFSFKFEIWRPAEASRSYAFIKIATLLSQSIYSLCLHVSFLLGRTTHYHVPHNTLPCVLIILTCADCPVIVV